MEKIDLTSWDRQIRLRSLTPNADFQRIAFDPSAAYQDIFKAGLQYRTYNFLLKDYSCFQFWHGSGNQPRNLRYAYYPNPFDVEDVTANELESSFDSELLEHELFEHLLEDSPLTIGRPPIRYDLDLDGHKECVHPSAHLTIGAHMNNRWPVAKILTPKLFTLLISKHYYPDFWMSMNRKARTKDGFYNNLDQLLADEKRLSRKLDGTWFTSIEKLHPFVD